MPAIHDTFTDGALPYWNRFAVGRAWVETCEVLETSQVCRLAIGPAPADALSDAELNDHRLFPRGRWPWRPPLRMSVRARASLPAADLIGTAGFGFWNAPFGADNDTLDAPQAVWFFHASPPSYLSMSRDGYGSGWRAQVLNAPRVPKVVVLLGGLAWFALKPLRPLFYRAAQTQVGGGEALVTARFDEWHTYRIDWLPSRVDFCVDDEKIFTSPSSPRGPLGFCAWMDNSMLNVRDGAFAFGNLAVPGRQWLELSEVSIQPLADSG
ncbi:MAG: family 16 glycosylhydrolase, partial [Chloroflexota bacterium]